MKGYITLSYAFNQISHPKLFDKLMENVGFQIENINSENINSYTINLNGSS